jgi:hypothetical protein
MRTFRARFAWQLVTRVAEQTMIQAFRDDDRWRQEKGVRIPPATLMLTFAIFGLVPYALLRPYALALWIICGRGPGLRLYAHHVGGDSTLTRGLAALDFSEFRSPGITHPRARPAAKP